MKTLIKTIALIITVLFNLQLFAQTENKAVVSADDMNIFYIGIDNPVSVAVPGITNDKLRVTISNGTISRNGDKYIVKVDKPGETIIQVAAEIKPGEIKSVGSSSFRAKKIPDPKACLGNNPNTALYMTREELLKNAEVNVLWNLPFDNKFEVISFSLTYVFNKDLITKTTTGNKFSPEMIEAVNKVEDGSKMFIEDIKVKGADGMVRTLSPIIIKLAVKE
jgi:gliding motility-associated protein GldM